MERLPWLQSEGEEARGDPETGELKEGGGGLAGLVQQEGGR